MCFFQIGYSILHFAAIPPFMTGDTFRLVFVCELLGWVFTCCGCLFLFTMFVVCCMLECYKLNFLNFFTENFRIVFTYFVLTMSFVVKGAIVFISVPMGRAEVTTTATGETKYANLYFACIASVFSFFLSFGLLARCILNILDIGHKCFT